MAPDTSTESLEAHDSALQELREARAAAARLTPDQIAWLRAGLADPAVDARTHRAMAAAIRSHFQADAAARLPATPPSTPHGNRPMGME